MFVPNSSIAEINNVFELFPFQTEDKPNFWPSFKSLFFHAFYLKASLWLCCVDWLNNIYFPIAYLFFSKARQLDTQKKEFAFLPWNGGLTSNLLS